MDFLEPLLFPLIVSYFFFNKAKVLGENTIKWATLGLISYIVPNTACELFLDPQFKEFSISYAKQSSNPNDTAYYLGMLFGALSSILSLVIPFYLYFKVLKAKTD